MQEVVGSTPIFSTTNPGTFVSGFFTFTPMLQITKHKNDHIELHLGPYFRGFLSTLAGFFIVLVIFAILVILIKDPIQSTSVKAGSVVGLIILLGILLNIFLGFEGIEFDLEKKEFRHYVKRLGIKFGAWQDLKPYSMLCLSAQYNRIGGRMPTGSSRQSHRSLEINLASLTHDAVMLAECKNYKVAEKAINELNQFLQIEIKDFVKEGYMKPSPRR